MTLSRLLAAVFILVAGSTGIAGAQEKYQRGPFTAAEASLAPEWHIQEWIVGPAQTMKGLRGKVVVIDFFQLWCPGCNQFTLPLIDSWETKFAAEIERGDLALVSIHTVFEGHSVQTNERLKTFVKEKGMDHPVGVDMHEMDTRLPDTMINYQTRGTPEIAIVDKQGRLRFQQFGYFDTDWAEGYLRELMAE